MVICGLILYLERVTGVMTDTVLSSWTLSVPGDGRYEAEEENKISHPADFIELPGQAGALPDWREDKDLPWYKPVSVSSGTSTSTSYKRQSIWDENQGKIFHLN